VALLAPTKALASSVVTAPVEEAAPVEDAEPEESRS
jgi:hypothetical protein